MTVYLSLTAERAVATAFQSLALSSTGFRLYRRYKQKNLWWDDCWVFVAFLLDVVYCSTIGMKEVHPNLTPQERYRQIVTFWMSGTLPPLIVWFSRISICLSIAKIDMQISICRIRCLFHCLITAFGLVVAAMLLQKVWICARDTSWHNAPVVQCFVGDTLGFVSLIGDLLADAALTIIFLNLAWGVRMRRSQRKLLSLIALANLLSSMAGIAYGVAEIESEKLGASRVPIMSLIVHIKAAITLTVSNLLVVVTYVYAIFSRSSGSNHRRTNTRTERHLHDDAESNKSTPIPRGRTIYILTQFDSNGSVIPQSQQGGLALYTWVGSELGWLPRTPSCARTRSEKSQELSSFPSKSSNASPSSRLTGAFSEPPYRPPKTYSSPATTSDERRPNTLQYTA